ncbi:MAG: alpha/beta hydrolase fold domain-containing protein [Solirubrobacterales bacterium]
MDVGIDSLIAPELRPLAAEAREYLATWKAQQAEAPDYDLRTPEGLAGMRGSLAPRGAPSGPPPQEIVARAGGSEVPVRILVPEDGEPRGVYLDIHGGGFFMSRAARNDLKNRRIADGVGVAVVSVDYRLAPEHPWPAAPDDCETAALWLLEEAESRFGTTRVAIGGASAGGNLAVTTLLRLRKRDLLEPFLGAALQFGAWDLSARTPGGRPISTEYLIEAYLGDVDDRAHADISPIFADLGGLPPALMIVGTEDILLEDNLAMAMRLAAAGGEVDLRLYPECPHGFTSFPTAMAEAAVSGMESWLADRFAGA